MSEEETFEVQGRVYSSLRKSYRAIDGLAETLQLDAKTLVAAANGIRDLLEWRGGRRDILVITNLLSPLQIDAIAARVTELDAEIERATALQKRVDQF